MAKTAAEVIRQALQYILVQESEAELEADEYQDALFVLDNMMTSWDAEGIALGYTELTALDGELTVPNGALKGVVANLAVEMAPQFDADVTPVLAAAASEGLRICRLIGQSVPTSVMPSTLPYGTGNNHTSGRTSDYYPDQEESILGETTGNIAVESDT